MATRIINSSVSVTAKVQQSTQKLIVKYSPSAPVTVESMQDVTLSDIIDPTDTLTVSVNSKGNQGASTIITSLPLVVLALFSSIESSSICRFETLAGTSGLEGKAGEIKSVWFSVDLWSSDIALALSGSDNITVSTSNASGATIDVYAQDAILKSPNASPLYYSTETVLANNRKDFAMEGELVFNPSNLSRIDLTPSQAVTNDAIMSTGIQVLAEGGTFDEVDIRDMLSGIDELTNRFGETANGDLLYMNADAYVQLHFVASTSSLDVYTKKTLL